MAQLIGPSSIRTGCGSFPSCSPSHRAAAGHASVRVVGIRSTEHRAGELHQGCVDNGAPGGGFRRLGQRQHCYAVWVWTIHARAPGRVDLRVAPPAEGYPSIGALSGDARTIPLYGVRVDWAGVSNRSARCWALLPRAPKLGAVTRIVAVSATRRTDAGRERVALNTAYVYALMRPGSFRSSCLPFSTRKRHAPRSRSARSRPVGGRGRRAGPLRGGAPPSWAKPIVPRCGRVALVAGAERRGLPISPSAVHPDLQRRPGGTLYQDLASERPGPVDHADARSRHGLRGRVWYPAPPYTRDRASEREQPATTRRSATSLRRCA